MHESADILLSYKLDGLIILAYFQYSQYTISPFVTPAVLPTAVHSFVEIQCQLAQQMHPWTTES